MNYFEDFPMLKKNLVYFDNAATTFKPISVINSIIDYYCNYSANSHRGDYNISFKVDDEIFKTRNLVKQFINARSCKEIIFTKNATDSLNMIVNGFFKYYLNEGDEVLLNKGEHASNLLPWIFLSKSKNIKINYAPIINNQLTIESIISSITPNTKVISLAYITNVTSDVRDIKNIISYAHKNNILVVVDAAQSIGHIKTDVQDLDADFLAFSGHKMLGPTGVGVLYGKYEWLKNMIPSCFGGGMNSDFSSFKLELADIPERFEAGTINISSIIGLKEAIKYINKVGFDNINRSVKYLKNYLIKELKNIPYIKILNLESAGSTLLIEAVNITSSDLALYLNSHNICVRSGSHCSKMLKEESEFNDTVRISLYFYNTYEEIDYLIKVLKDKNNLYNF